MRYAVRSLIRSGGILALPKRFELLTPRFVAKILDGDFRLSFWMDLVALHAAGPFIARLRVPPKSQIRPGG
jgi:hypothetical protein